MDVAGLLVHDRAGPRVHALDLEVRKVRDLFELFRPRVVRPDIVRPVTVGNEVHRAAQPHGLLIAAVGPRQLLEGAGVKVDQLDRLVLAAAVVAHLVFPGIDLLVGEPLPVGRDRAGHRLRYGDARRQSTVDRDAPELRLTVGHSGARRHEHDPRAVRCPSAGLVDAGMERQSFRLTTGGGHDVHVRIATVLTGEREPFPVGREMRIALDGRRRRHPARVATGARDDPDVAGVGERDLRRADIGLME